MLKVNAYYQFIFNLDLEGEQVSDDGGTPVITFKDEQDLNRFIEKHNLAIHSLPNDMKVLTDSKKESVYGQLTD